MLVVDAQRIRVSAKASDETARNKNITNKLFCDSKYTLKNFNNHTIYVRNETSLYEGNDSLLFNTSLKHETLFIPIVVLLFVYAGYQYIMAQGNPSKVANLKKLVSNILLGIILILCSWLIVKVILTVLVQDEDSALQFLE